jgi:hypothetical protein
MAASMSSMESLKTEIEDLERKVKSTKRIYRRSILKAKIRIKRRVKDAIHTSIERIHRPGFRHEESLVRIYSMIDKPSYILKVKPSKYYLTRILGGFANLLIHFKTFLVSKLSPPPTLYSKSYPFSMIELRFWYIGVYQRLARKPKGFKDAFIRWKSSLGNYKVKIENSIRRNKNVTKKFFD